jgi:hypothetical protein
MASKPAKAMLEMAAVVAATMALEAAEVDRIATKSIKFFMSNGFAGYICRSFSSETIAAIFLARSEHDNDVFLGKLFD